MEANQATREGTASLRGEPMDPAQPSENSACRPQRLPVTPRVSQHPWQGAAFLQHRCSLFAPQTQSRLPKARPALAPRAAAFTSLLGIPAAQLCLRLPPRRPPPEQPTLRQTSCNMARAGHAAARHELPSQELHGPHRGPQQLWQRWLQSPGFLLRPVRLPWGDRSRS